MKLVLNLFTFALSISLFAADDFNSGAVGCKGASQSYRMRYQAAVHILNSILENKNDSERKSTIESYIEMQTKHFIGLSKHYKTIQLSKIAIGAFRTKPTILSESAQSIQLPSLNSYWASNIHLGSDPNVLALVANSDQLVAMKVVRYETEIIITTCAPLPLSLQTAFDELNAIYFPANPYLTFWINTSEERDIRTVKNGATGVIPNCLSDDFLIYGTAPEYGWYYWQPRHRGSSRICQIKNKHLVTNLNVQNILPISIQNNTKLFAQDEKGPRQIAAIFGQVSRSAAPKQKPYDQLFADIKSILESCQRASQGLGCYSDLEKYSLGGNKKMDSGQISLVQFLKFYSVMTEKHKIKADSISADEILFKIESENKADGQKVTLSLYSGPTGVFDTFKAPTLYWNFLLKSLYATDLLLYFGHAGTGQNLALESILKKSTLKINQMSLRTKDLNFGVFNCEGYSYFGWDLNSIFDASSLAKSKSHNINMVASSGVEVSSTFMSAYVENFLNSKDVTVRSFTENMSKYVQSDDFLVYEKIKILK